MEHLELLRALSDAGASDIHCKPGSVPVLRVGADLVRHGEEKLTVEDVATIAQALLNTDSQAELIKQGATVGAHSEPGIGRFRVAAFRQRGSVALVIHSVPYDVPKLADLGLPLAAETLAGADRGLVLVASAVGNGASTTLAALVDHVNTTRLRHVVTVEDPIEVLHSDGIGIVSQLEVGADVRSAADGIRSATRIDSDVIVVSDVADRDTATAVLDAVARGRLVIGGVGGQSVFGAVQGFLELFTVTERDIVRGGLARSIKGVIAQRLLPTLDGGRAVAVESMVHTTKIEHCIATAGRPSEMRALLEEGEYHGMQTMDQALATLAQAGRIDVDTALGAATDAEDLRIELLR